MTDHEFLKKLYQDTGVYNIPYPMIHKEIYWQLNDTKPNSK